MLNFKVTCKNCKSDGKIQTTMESDSGYSNWTVMDNGYVEFKCHGCGKFASTDEYKDKPNNQPENFEVECNKCGSKEWGYNIQDVDGEDEPTHILCKKCGAKESQA